LEKISNIGKFGIRARYARVRLEATQMPFPPVSTFTAIIPGSILLQLTEPLLVEALLGDYVSLLGNMNAETFADGMIH